MHALMFQLKRAHLSAIKGARALSYRTGLTPARHDVMTAITRFGNGEGDEYQSRISQTLGLSRTTISRMVRRLVDLGLLSRRRSPHDRRTFLVRLTREGARRWRRVLFITVRYKPLQRRFERAFGERSWTTYYALTNLIFAVERIAKHLGDTSWPLQLIREPNDFIDVDADDWQPPTDEDVSEDADDDQFSAGVSTGFFSPCGLSLEEVVAGRPTVGGMASDASSRSMR